MGAIAEAHAEHVIVTNDNPRTEDPARIVADILAGMRTPEHVIVERDRRAAIASALRSARPGDAVLVAGKGHEDYQIIGAQRLAFSDRTVITELLGAKP
jgi:UDP-N-acetylmuramoyl-L-alanyl-D-glutamate--2,6-diaminopimelate ligase